MPEKQNGTALPLDDYDGEPTAQSEMARRGELPEPLIFDSAPPRFKTYWLRNDEGGEIYQLGPMYGGTVEYAVDKLRSENLTFAWTLLAPVGSSHA